jgi:uncharacterized protein (DUF4415 family)
MPRLKPNHVFSSPSEDASIVAAAHDDEDNPPLLTEAFGLMREPLRRLGRPRLEHPKARLTMRVDADVLDKLKAYGPGWQTRVNEFLRELAASGCLEPGR